MTKRPGKSEHDHLEGARERLLDAVLPHVVFDGWSRAALDAAAAEAGVEAGLARLAFPRGGIDMVVAFHRRADRRLAGDLAAADLSAMRIRERIAHCVRRRIELVADHREAVRRGAALMALPSHAPEAARLVWETADIIWNACGDSASDYNWYTKRLTLGGVYSASMLYWLGDSSPGFANSWAFLERRIEDVMRIEKAKAQVEGSAVLRAAFWGPRTLLGMVRAPGASRGPEDPVNPGAGRSG